MKICISINNRLSATEDTLPNTLDRSKDIPVLYWTLQSYLVQYHLYKLLKIAATLAVNSLHFAYFGIKLCVNFNERLNAIKTFYF